MKLYLITTHDDQGDDQQVKWVASQSDAGATRAQLVKDGFSRKDIKTTGIDVPTTKTELLEFLNLLAQGGVNTVIATDRLLTK